MSPRQIGHYEIRSLLGRGGIGEVYWAFDTELERDVALKTLRPEFSLDRSFLDRFRTEATSLAKLNHPNIATLYSLFKDGDTMCMVMELVRGHTLETVLQRTGQFSVQDSLAVIAQAVAGLRYAHRMGVIHRDIKPSNLMLTDAGVLKIMDFGIARIQGSQRLTRQGDVVGTLSYAPPEQLRGHEGDGRSDLYSLATVLYEMLSGRLPFNATSEYELMRAQVETLPPTLEGLCRDLDANVEDALMRALAKAPEDRFGTVEEFGRALGATALTADAPDMLRDGLLQSMDEAEQVGTRLANPRYAKPDDTSNEDAHDPPQSAARNTGVETDFVMDNATRLQTARVDDTSQGNGTSSIQPRKSPTLMYAGAGGAVVVAAVVLFFVFRPHPAPVSDTDSNTGESAQHIVLHNTAPPPTPVNVPPISLLPPASAPDSGAAAQQPAPDLPGNVDQVLDSGALIVGGKVVNLFGVRGEDGRPAQAMQRYLKGQGNQLQCFAKGKAFQCLAGGEDVAEHALRNGWVRAREGAPAQYTNAEHEARKVRAGVWAM
ncbi:serine/threonine-protein kinase [Paraburkholderia sp. C35]|uniref:serine/threonine protein kinase n=1 Tax=Paraburkholderia sp. C35 TaxID=2126993 RepID=UPI0013A5AF3D|nr:serine/threonine-protein kinase [Paraburkholderia sp. C35]